MDGTTEKKTPADFTQLVTKYHADLDAAQAEMSQAQARLDGLAGRRQDLIGDARDYGYTGAYARTLLRKP